MNILSKFLSWCAGADNEILKKLPAEITKYHSVGITILFTGVFAALSGGYAAYTIFHILWVAVLIGLIWGFMIFNLDRFIVMSIKKTDNFSKELLTALPRILLALIISLVVAKPLEIRIFKDRIKRVIATKELDEKENDVKRLDSIYGKTRVFGEIQQINLNLAKFDSIKDGLPKGEYFQSLKNKKTTFNNSINSKTAKRKREQTKISNFFNQYTYIDTLNGKAIKKKAFRSSHLPLGAWNKIKPTVNRRDNLSKEIKDILTEISSIDAKIQSEIENHKKEYQDKINQFNTNLGTKEKEQKKIDMFIATDTIKLRDVNKIAFSENFITQLEALGTLTKYKKSTINNDETVIAADNTMYWINLAIILLFIVIETAPIFVKLITSKGQYDIALEAKFLTDESKIVSDSNIKILQDEKREEIALFKEEEDERMKKQLLTELFKKRENQKKVDIQNIQTEDEYQNMIDEIMDSQKNI